MYEIAFLLSYVVIMLNMAAAGSDSSGHTAGSDSSGYAADSDSSGHEKNDHPLDRLEEAMQRKEESMRLLKEKYEKTDPEKWQEILRRDRELVATRQERFEVELRRIEAEAKQEERVG